MVQERLWVRGSLLAAHPLWSLPMVRATPCLKCFGRMMGVVNAPGLVYRRKRKILEMNP